MRILTASGQPSLSDDDLLERYPWPGTGRWVRAMMVTTLDGASVGPDALSGSISSGVDRTVFDSVRRLADAVLVGAGTIRAERYRPMRAKPADADRRAAAGLSEAPRLAIVSATLNFDWVEPMWTESTHRPIIFTTPGSPRADEARLHAEVVELAGERVDLVDVLDALEGRGLRRIDCEGGPKLLNDLVRQGLVDEADITVSPTFVGTELSPVTLGIDLESASQARFELAHALTQDDFLMLRYLRKQAR